MEFNPVCLLQDSPPYQPHEDDFFSSSSEISVWDDVSLVTPPLSPVDSAAADKEVITHLSSHFNQLRAIPEAELERDIFQCSDVSCIRGDSPAILNDIMWNAGQRTKRPDSAMDIDVRFNLNSTPIAFEQHTTNIFVDTDELFSLALFDSSVNNDETQENQQLSKKTDQSNSFQDFSESDEEIDVVSVQTDAEQENEQHFPAKIKSNAIICEPPNQPMRVERETPKLSLQRMADKRDDTSTSDSDCENTRVSHNDLERKRRNELRGRFNHLRGNIPSLADNEKAAKITILRRAYELVPVLQGEEKTLLAEKELEKQRNVQLLKKLLKLTRAKRT